MTHHQLANKIRQLALDFDNAVASKNQELALTYFTDDCGKDWYNITTS
jgi:ketosteroid isomerase-like protein